MTAACENCRYSDLAMINIIDEGDIPHMLCRRHPPQMVGDREAGMPLWPLVHEGEWCGEFLKKQDTRVDNYE